GIAYVATNIDDGMKGRKSQLRWAQASSASPASMTDWTVVVIAEIKIPCAGLCGDTMKCVAADDTCVAPDSTPCTPDCTGDNACIGGSCVATRPDPKVTDIPEGTGQFASAVRLPDGRPAIAYYDRSTGDLELAVLDPSGMWNIVPLDAHSETDTGQWASAAV